jgi:PAS domain S-box-containing protein
MCSSHESVFTKMTGENLAIALAESFAEKNSKLAELRVIVEACPLATFISDSNGRCVYVNQAYQELIGRPYRACLDMHWKSFIHLDDLGDALRAWARAVKTSGVYDYEYRIVRPGGAAAQWRFRRLHQRDQRDELQLHVRGQSPGCAGCGLKWQE